MNLTDSLPEQRLHLVRDWQRPLLQGPGRREQHRDHFQLGVQLVHVRCRQGDGTHHR